MRRTYLAAAAIVVAVGGAYFLGTVHRPLPVTAADLSTASVPGSSVEQGVLVSGLGTTSGTPDVLRVSLGVEVRRGDVSSALRDANSLQKRIHDAFRKAGVAEKDLQTSTVSLGAAVDSKGHPDGYTVSEQPTAKLHNLSKAGSTISSAVSAGGNAARLQGVSFDLEDNAGLLQKARDAAFADAKRKAQRYADLAGRTLGPVELVTEGQPQTYAGMSPRAAAGDVANPVPISPGEAQISVSVTVRWSLR
ncbi:MAG: SIMPL domain-containing protein [Actinomycetota bacterium]|nr:SIMPL domain-containing protein [Actinomycetota bacterium]